MWHTGNGHTHPQLIDVRCVGVEVHTCGVRERGGRGDHISNGHPSTHNVMEGREQTGLTGPHALYANVIIDEAGHVKAGGKADDVHAVREVIFPATGSGQSRMRVARGKAQHACAAFPYLASACITGSVATDRGAKAMVMHCGALLSTCHAQSDSLGPAAAAPRISSWKWACHIVTWGTYLAVHVECLAPLEGERGVRVYLVRQRLDENVEQQDEQRGQDADQEGRKPPKRHKTRGQRNAEARRQAQRHNRGCGMTRPHAPSNAPLLPPTGAAGWPCS